MSAYKVLDDDRRSFHGGTGMWTPGKWRSVSGPLTPCQRGIHYCTREQLVRWLGPTVWLFEDGTPDETIDHGDKMVTRCGRVTERVKAWNDTTARLFAADCAAAVLALFERVRPDDDRPRKAIEAARLFAQGEIDAAALAAARAAAWAAAGAAASSAGRAAAWDAAGDAAASAGRDAAGAAAWAAGDAAWDAAGDAAASAGRAAAWADQTEILFDYLEGRRS